VLGVQCEKAAEFGSWFHFHDPIVLNDNPIEEQSRQAIALLLVCHLPPTGDALQQLG